MATKKTTASKTAKKAAPAKKVAAVQKSVATKKVVPAKKTVAAKPAAKKTVVPAKKAAPAKTVKKAAPVKVAAKKAAPKKAAPATKKAAPAKQLAKVASPKNAVTAKSGAKKVAAPAKKAVSAKKAAPAPKKVAPAKKTVVVKPAVKKAAPAPIKKIEKKVAPAPTKPAPKPVAKKAEPIKVAVKETKAETPAKEKKEAKPAKPAAAPKRKPQQHVVTSVPSARSEIVDAVRQLPRKTAPKPGVVIAHRKIEKKAPQEEPGLTMKEYNPSVRSLLDEPEQSSGPVYRYSDEELNEFKELINKRLDNARKELAYLQGLITRKDEAGTDDTDNRFNHMEDGSGAMEREQLSQLAGRQIQFINHLEKAMIRIENKTYGICRVTGKLIDKARLRAVPHATLSIEAKNVMNK